MRDSSVQAKKTRPVDAKEQPPETPAPAVPRLRSVARPAVDRETTPWDACSIQELRAELRQRGLPTTGLRYQLAARLHADDGGSGRRGELRDASTQTAWIPLVSSPSRSPSPRGAANIHPPGRLGPPAPTSPASTAPPPPDLLRRHVSISSGPPVRKKKKSGASFQLPSKSDIYHYWICQS